MHWQMRGLRRQLKQLQASRQFGNLLLSLEQSLEHLRPTELVCDAHLQALESGKGLLSSEQVGECHRHMYRGRVKLLEKQPMELL